MANLQPTYASGVAVAVAGMIANEERANRISRTVESALLAFGQPAFRGANDHGVIAGAAFAATSVSAADAGNVGSGTITATPAVAAGAKSGVYIVEMLATGVAGAFNLIDPDGLIVDDGVAGTAKTAGGIGPFTIGGTPTISDRFTITVTFTADAKYLGITALNPAVPAVASTGVPDAYPQYWTASIMTMGPIWVNCGGTVTPGQAVYWDPATTLYSADTTKIRIPNARFDTSGVNGGLVLVLIRLRDA